MIRSNYNTIIRSNNNSNRRIRQQLVRRFECSSSSSSSSSIPTRSAACTTGSISFPVHLLEQHQQQQYYYNNYHHHRHQKQHGFDVSSSLLSPSSLSPNMLNSNTYNNNRFFHHQSILPLITIDPKYDTTFNNNTTIRSYNTTKVVTSSKIESDNNTTTTATTAGNTTRRNDTSTNDNDNNKYTTNSDIAKSITTQQQVTLGGAAVTDNNNISSTANKIQTKEPDDDSRITKTSTSTASPAKMNHPLLRPSSSLSPKTQTDQNKKKTKKTFIPRKAAVQLTDTAREYFRILVDNPPSDDSIGIILKYEQSTSGEPRMVFIFDYVTDTDIDRNADEGVSLEVIQVTDDENDNNVTTTLPKPPTDSYNDGLRKLYIHHNAFLKVLGATIDIDPKTFTPTLYDRDGFPLDPNA